jgi:very-short-patch-repair endonuclease
MKEMYTYNKNYNSFFDGELNVLEINREKKNKSLTTNEFIKKAKEVHGNKYDYSSCSYIAFSKKVCIFCNKHKSFFWQTPTNHLSGYGCPDCGYHRTNFSSAEEEIKEYLIKNNIEFIHQKRFDDCKAQKKLIFDFYLPRHNTLIEYDGEQHYIEVSIWGGKLGLEKRQFNDKIKTEYATSKGYKLLRIPYTERLFLSEVLKNNIAI